MDSNATRRDIALISVHPEFAEGLLSGSKEVEFRRTRFPSELGTVVVYATSPVRRIIGYFEVSSVEHGSPNQIWRRFGRVGGIDRQRYQSYFAGAKAAVAICVQKPWTLKHSLDLSSIGISAAPQSFQYLRTEQFQKIQRRAASVMGDDLVTAGDVRRGLSGSPHSERKAG